MSDNAEARPRQVTWGASFATGAAAVLVLSSFDAMRTLRSVDTREGLAKALDSASARGLGLSVDDATSVMHAMLLVGGAAAAAAVVFGVYAFRGNVAARAVLTVLAVVVLVCSTAVDPLLGVAVALAVTMLWSRPARDWFAGRPVTQPGGSVRDSVLHAEGDEPGSGEPPAGTPADRPGDPPPPAPEAAGPRAVPGWGTPPQAGPQTPAYPGPSTAPTASQPTAWGPQPGWAAPYGPPPGTPPKAGTPATVRAAAVVTWVFGALALGAFLVTAIMMATNRDEVVDLMTRQPGYQDLRIGVDELIVAVWVVMAMFVVWTLLAMVFAAFVWRGHEWARVLLAISSGVCLLLCFPTLPVSALHLLAAGAVLALLFSGPSNRWFRERRASASAWRPPPGPPAAGPGPGPGPGGPAGPAQGSGSPPVW